MLSLHKTFRVLVGRLLESLHCTTYTGLRVVLDFVPNHTSDQHEWFLKSQRREEPYTDYYVWADAKGVDEAGHPIPPNNWVREEEEGWKLSWSLCDIIISNLVFPLQVISMSVIFSSTFFHL